MKIKISTVVSTEIDVDVLSNDTIQILTENLWDAPVGSVMSEDLKIEVIGDIDG